MSEQQLQFKIVTTFHNRFPEHRGMLLEINNSTNKGAYRKGMGLVKGASDLLFISPEGYVFTFELKENGSRHEVKHLQRQLDWARKINGKVNGAAFFIFGEDQFFRIMDLILQDLKIRYCCEAGNSLRAIGIFIEEAATKTVKIQYTD